MATNNRNFAGLAFGLIGLILSSTQLHAQTSDTISEFTFSTISSFEHRTNQLTITGTEVGNMTETTLKLFTSIDLHRNYDISHKQPCVDLLVKTMESNGQFHFTLEVQLREDPNVYGDPIKVPTDTPSGYSFLPNRDSIRSCGLNAVSSTI